MTTLVPAARSAIALGCAITIMALGGACAQGGDDAEAMARSRGALETARSLQPDDSVCRLEGGNLRYIGGSGDTLLACINAHESADRLVITSFGGGVDATLDAADALDQAQLDLTVLGICYSSCANYLAPAAREVSVSPYSAIVLHGGPTDEIEALRAELADALRAAGAPEAALDRLVEEQVAQALELKRRHDAFVARHSISQTWYHPSALLGTDAEQVQADRPVAGVAVPEPAFKRCVPNTRAGPFWFPQTVRGARAVERLIGLGSIAFAGLDAPEPVYCAPAP